MWAGERRSVDPPVNGTLRCLWSEGKAWVTFDPSQTTPPGTGRDAATLFLENF